MKDKTINDCPKWNRLVFGKLSAEDPAPNVVENLPPYKEVVIVTDGTRVWLDVFEEDAWLHLSFSNRRVTEVVAWMQLTWPLEGATNGN